MNAPSLHEIAAMPFPASMIAMRKHYNKDWHKPEAEPGTLRLWKVTVKYSVRSTERQFYNVEAASREDAIEQAENLFDEGPYGKDPEVEVDDVAAKEVE